MCRIYVQLSHMTNLYLNISLVLNIVPMFKHVYIADVVEYYPLRSLIPYYKNIINRSNYNEWR